MNAARTERGERNLDLIMRAQSEDEETSMLALEAIIEENMGLVRSIALRFRDRGTDYEAPFTLSFHSWSKAVAPAPAIAPILSQQT